MTGTWTTPVTSQETTSTSWVETTTTPFTTTLTSSEKAEPRSEDDEDGLGTIVLSGVEIKREHYGIEFAAQESGARVAVWSAVCVVVVTFTAFG